MNRILSKLAAYIISIIGCLIVIGCILGAVAPFLYIGKLDPARAWLFSIGCIVVVVIVGIITFALFELLLEAGSSDDYWEQKEKFMRQQDNSVKDLK